MMSSQAGASYLFDQTQRKLRLARADRRLSKYGMSFLWQRAADDLTDRLLDINRSFESVLYIGPDAVFEYVLSQLGPEKIKRGRDEAGCHDLIISTFSLHTEDNIAGFLKAVRGRLKPDGLFVGGMFGGETLGELRRACYDVDEEKLGGFTPRIFPFASYQQAAGLLQQAGFALPVIDMDRVHVSYSRFARLIDDLRDMGETNILFGRSKHFMGRGYRAALEEAYLIENPSDSGKFDATFEMIWLTGWEPHDSQQQPLKPGSAQVSLTDIFEEQ